MSWGVYGGVRPGTQPKTRIPGAQFYRDVARRLRDAVRRLYSVGQWPKGFFSPVADAIGIFESKRFFQRSFTQREVLDLFVPSIYHYLWIEQLFSTKPVSGSVHPR